MPSNTLLTMAAAIIERLGRHAASKRSRMIRGFSPKEPWARTKVRREDARWHPMPKPGHSRPKAVPAAWRVERRRATRCQEGKLAALALIEAAAPRNEVEGALAVQMACTHTAAMSILARFRGGGGTEHRVVAFATAALRRVNANLATAYPRTARARFGGTPKPSAEFLT
jgi:hypothetical protein